MVELRFLIRNSVFNVQDAPGTAAIRRLSLCLPSLEEAALLSEVDEKGCIIPRREVFFLTNLPTGPVIEGFEDCALGEFVKAQLEAVLENGVPPEKCVIYGLDGFLDPIEPEQADRLRDIISVCECRSNEFAPETVVRFMSESGFFDEYIIVGIKQGNGWRRSRCITTFEDRPGEAATILRNLAEYLAKEQEDDKPHDDLHV
jgi:hypothetical protein